MKGRTIEACVCNNLDKSYPSELILSQRLQQCVIPWREFSSKPNTASKNCRDYPKLPMSGHSEGNVRAKLGLAYILPVAWLQQS